MEEEEKTIHRMDDFINDRHQVLVFPIKYNDLPRNACLYIQLVTVKDTMMAQVYLPLWNAKGRLVTGLQRVKMVTHRSETMHSVVNNPILVQDEYDTSSHQYEFDDEKWEATLILDKIQQMQIQRDLPTMMDSSASSTNMDTMHSNKHGSISSTSNSTSINTSTITTTTNSTSVSLHPLDSNSVPWLDEMTSMRCKDILQEPITYSISVEQDENTTMRNQPTYQYNMLPSFSHSQSTTFHLILELLDCPIPIVHQEILYTPHHVSVASISSASGSVTALDLAMNHKANQSSLESKEGFNTINQHQEDHPTHNGYSSGVYMPNPIAKDGQEDDMGLRLVQYFDPESIDDNPVEDKYRTLQHELIRGLVDPALKPNAEERSTLNAIISGTRQHLTSQEKDLLWKFRFSLVDNRQALTKFLLAVEWTVESEVVQAAELLEQWRRRSPIEVSDALKLLGRNVAFQTDLVRGYAIDTLQEAPDVELSLYLLQLVQALKYEHENVENTVISDVSKKRNSRSSSLSVFLIQRASKNIELANYLYWYLKVELEDEVFGRRYREVFSDMREQLLCIEHESSSNLEHRSMWDVLAEQDIFISNVMECQRKSRDAKGKKDAKEEFLKDSLAKSAYQSMNQDWSVPLPSAPHIWVKGVKADSARMFKSALYPALIDFYVDEKLSSRDQSHLSKETYKVIVKTGDDLRQDQLVITLIKLMDRILKRGALDLCLKPYPIIAMSQSTGLVTFVEGSIPISQVLASYNNSILSFFKNVAPSDEGKYNVDPNVMQTYIRSCAGYCVITYLIGVGDRHLDNIMLQPSGHCECLEFHLFLFVFFLLF
jgi:phosphatidylinositol 3-kinase